MGNRLDRGLGDYADRLLADVTDLETRLADLTFPPEAVVGGAAVLMEEVAANKVSGEEDRYSHTDIYDFKGNVEGAEKIYDLMRPLIPTDAEFTTKVDQNFATVNEVLARYEAPGGGYVPYGELNDRDRTLLSARVNTLAEDLATLRGKLGLD